MVYLHGRDQFARYNDPFIHLFLNSRITARMEEEDLFSTLSLSPEKTETKERRGGQARRGIAEERRRKSVKRPRRRTSETYLHADAIQGREVGGDG